jgi:tol-pal system protein YbgF
MEDDLRRINGITKGMIILAGVLFFGCATSRDVQVLDRDIDKSYSEIKVLKKENDTFKNELSIIKNEMAGLKSDLSMENQRVKADLLLQIKNLQTEIRSLSTGVEEYKEFSKRPSKEVDRMKGDLEGRIRILEERGRTSEEKNKYQEGKNKELEEQNKFQEGKIKELEDHLRELAGKMDKLASKQAEIEKPPPSKEILSEIKGVSAGAGDLYKDAYETFQKGDLEGARRKFETFLKQYPNTELSDNTQFWIGETFYLKKDYEKAILEYEKAIVKYPEGDKIPSALFKQALAFLELGDKTNARNLFRRVIERYPQSDQAEMAKKRLDAIK